MNRLVAVRFEPSGATLMVPPGTTLLKAARDAGLPVGSSCDGDGVCGRCGLAILAGRDALSEETPEEARIKVNNRVDPADRLACRARVLGDVAVTARYW